MDERLQTIQSEICRCQNELVVLGHLGCGRLRGGESTPEESAQRKEILTAVIGRVQEMQIQQNMFLQGLLDVVKPTLARLINTISEMDFTDDSVWGELKRLLNDFCGFLRKSAVSLRKNLGLLFVAIHEGIVEFTSSRNTPWENIQSEEREAYFKRMLQEIGKRMKTNHDKFSGEFPEESNVATKIKEIENILYP